MAVFQVNFMAETLGRTVPLFVILPTDKAYLPGMPRREEGKPYKTLYLLHGIIGKDLIEVNSFHHQAVRDPAPGLAVSAFAPDGIIEAVEGTEGSFLLGVQWHPEYMSRIREDMLGIFKAFIKEAQK